MLVVSTKNRHILYLGILVLLGFQNLKAQDTADYERVYVKTYLETAQKDFQKAIFTADSLLQISQSPYFKAKSLMLSASLYQQIGDFKSSIENALAAENHLENTNEWIWKAKIYGFLATQYRIVGLFPRSIFFIEKCTQTLNKIDNPQTVNYIEAQLLEEKAYYELELKNYAQSIVYVNQSQEKYNKIEGTDIRFFTAGLEQLLGQNYYQLKNFEKSETFYLQALNKLEEMPDNYVKGLVYVGLVKVYIEKKDFSKAKFYLEKAEPLSIQSAYLALQKEMYATSQKFYLATKNLEQFQKSKILYDSISEIIVLNARDLVQESFKEIEKSNQKLALENKGRSQLNWAYFGIILVGLCGFFVYRKRQKRKNIEINDRLAKWQLKYDQRNLNSQKELLEETKEEIILENIEVVQTDDCEEDSSIMSQETEDKLLKKLKTFEKSKLFTQRNMSLSQLAAYCETNTKYLSYLINTHKEKDFNNYINELRIYYIIDIIKANPNYLKYKVSTLADESGFSTASKFSIAFKKVVDLSPSEFLNSLKHHNQDSVKQ